MKDKKSMAMIIIVGIVISLFLFVNSTVFATTGVVITNDLRVRKEESTSSEIIEILDENNKVEIISDNGEWYKVKANGKIGYVSKQYVKIEDGNEAKNENASNENKTENTSNEANNENKQQEVTENNNAETNQATEETPEVKEQPKTCKFTSDVELKVMPLICGNVIDSAKNGETYNVISTAGVWSYIKSDSKAGWVLTEKITLVDSTENKTEENKAQENTPNQEEQKQEEKKEEEKVSTEKMYSKAKTYYVKGTSVNARSAANKSSDVIKVFNTNSSVKVTGEDGDWYIIDINGDKAYIAKSLLSKEKVEVTSRSSTSLDQQAQEKQESESQAPAAQEQEQSAPSNPSGSAIVAYAKQFLGYSYVYGTNGPNTFDCSGFVQYVYKHFGYSLSRSSSTQANDGVAVSKSNLEPGDVLIFRDTSNSRIGHVGLYIGGGQFIHASNSRTGVIISDLSTSAYQKRYVGARRIL
ncbi:MAG: C40 family peptidase [Clostridia bacterium]|nr:C40 family peptidase [Clostridia bacterium]